jgi:hypothetical protein
MSVYSLTAARGAAAAAHLDGGRRAANMVAIRRLRLGVECRPARPYPGVSSLVVEPGALSNRTRIDPRAGRRRSRRRGFN